MYCVRLQSARRTPTACHGRPTALGRANAPVTGPRGSSLTASSYRSPCLRASTCSAGASSTLRFHIISKSMPIVRDCYALVIWKRIVSSCQRSLCVSTIFLIVISPCAQHNLLSRDGSERVLVAIGGGTARRPRRSGPTVPTSRLRRLTTPKGGPTMESQRRPKHRAARGARQGGVPEGRALLACTMHCKPGLQELAGSVCITLFQKGPARARPPPNLHRDRAQPYWLPAISSFVCAFIRRYQLDSRTSSCPLRRLKLKMTAPSCRWGIL